MFLHNLKTPQISMRAQPSNYPYIKLLDIFGIFVIFNAHLHYSVLKFCTNIYIVILMLKILLFFHNRENGPGRKSLPGSISNFHLVDVLDSIMKFSIGMKCTLIKKKLNSSIIFAENVHFFVFQASITYHSVKRIPKKK